MNSIIMIYWRFPGENEIFFLKLISIWDLALQFNVIHYLFLSHIVSFWTFCYLSAKAKQSVGQFVLFGERVQIIS